MKIDHDVFVWIQKNILKGVFGFGSIGFVVICCYTFSNKTAFLLSFLTPLNASELKNKVAFLTYFLKVGISCEL